MDRQSIGALWGECVVRRPWRVMAVTLLLVLAAAAGARLLEFTADYRYFFEPDDPYRQAYETLEKTYTKPDNILFVLSPGDGQVFTRDALQAVHELTEGAWRIPHAIRVDSIANFQYSRADGDTLVVEDLAPPPEKLDAQALAQVRERALGEPLLRNRLIAPAGDVTGVNVTLQFPGVSPTTELPEAVRAARELAGRIEAGHSGLRIHLTGVAMMNNAFPEASQVDNQRLMPIMLVAIVAVAALLLRSVAGMLTTVLVTVMSIAVAMGAAGYAGITLTTASASAPSIILTMGVANSVHLLVTFMQGLGAGRTRREAMVESLRVNLAPVFLTNLTTSIGFLTLNFGDSPPFHDMGNITAMGVGALFVLSVTLLPAFAVLMPFKARSGEPRVQRLMTRLGECVVRHRGALLWGTLTLAIGIIAFIPRNELDDQFYNYFDETTAFRQASDFTHDHLTGTGQLEFSLDSGEPGGIADPDYLERLDAFAEWLRTQPGVRHVAAITDIMKRLNRNMHGDAAAWYRVPESRELAAQYLLLYEMSLPYGLDLNDRIDIGKSATRVTAAVDNLTSNELLALTGRAEQWLADNATPAMQAHGAGAGVMSAHMSHSNSRSMLVGTSVALALISLLLVFALRSVKVGLVSLLPNLLPLGMAYGLWGLAVGRVGVAASAISAIALGIVVDDTIHFLSKYLRLRRELGLAPADAVRQAFTTVGPALLLTSLILVCGFLVLSFSSFTVNAEIGRLTAMALTLALLMDFLFLPPLLLKM